MNLITVVEPIVEPVTLEELYLHLRLDPDGSPPTHPDDELLESQLKSAREQCEAITRRSFVQRTLRLVLPCFPVTRVSFRGLGLYSDEDDSYEIRPSGIKLLAPPVQSIESISYYDVDNELQFVEEEDYFLSANSFIPTVELIESAIWPDTYRRNDAVLVNYVAGYAASGSPPDDYRANIPSSIKEAIKLQVQLLYDEISPEKRVLLEKTVRSLLASNRVNTF